MECLWFLGGFYLDLVARGQDFVRDRSPSIAFDTLVPAIMVVVLWLIISYVDGVLLVLFLQLVVVSGRERIDVDHTAVCKDFVVDEWRELVTTKSESDMASRGCVQKPRLGRIDTLQ